ncbi:DUF956 family protein [Ligilactobacillus ceti]|uniref:ManO family protein n=1 Tax=Ligilactobacillus ceti DSM 22408 TaxID=1122146 RepID=A0A0R2KJW2_9LACO|nr:DUF956 family protein [Ligilactobacillus ceti]KRN89647.1 ManO family protein [Ligilactobacillus ceti DSM 22408]
MVASLNTKVDLVVEGTSFIGINEYGEIMVGDNAFEFYNKRDSRKFIQIPWEEVDYVVASVMFKGRWIPRYGIQTKKNGMFTFSSKEPKKVLRAINVYIPREKMLHSLSFFQVLRRGIGSRFNKKQK